MNFFSAPIPKVYGFIVNYGMSNYVFNAIDKLLNVQ